MIWGFDSSKQLRFETSMFLFETVEALAIRRINLDVEWGKREALI